jgi:hypothetical protein
MNGSVNEETARAMERLEHELCELRCANEQMTRRFRQLRGGAIAVAAGFLVLGVCTPAWVRSMRAQAPAPPGGFQIAAQAAPAPMAFPGAQLIEVGRYYINPYQITHSYVSNGRRLLFFGAAQPLVLDDRESDLIRRFVGGDQVPQAPGVPAPAPVDPDGRAVPAPAAPRAPAIVPPAPTPTAPG